MTQLTLNEFINNFRSPLLEAVKAQCTPLFSETINPRDAEILAKLSRAPYPGQARIIHAMKALLIDCNQPAGIINADMGTGKTLMSIGVSALCEAYGHRRTLVICPPHLVYKWKREIMMTRPDAQVMILNGNTSLQRLITLRDHAHTYGTDRPVYFIIGRVRLRLGHYWRRAFALNWRDEVCCPRCGEVQMSRFDTPLKSDDMQENKKYHCQTCREPLWQLMHRVPLKSPRQALIEALAKLPTLGKRRAAQLIDRFGETLIMNALSDNIDQLINLSDENGHFIFSDGIVKKLERAIASGEFFIGTGDYQLSEYLKRYFPPKYFGLMIIDEAHEYKNQSAQGAAMGTLAACCARKTLLLTGTLMGGYADDLFYLLMRIMPKQMFKDGYGYNDNNALTSALTAFMVNHGVLKAVKRDTNDESFKTAKGKKSRTNVRKLPGISPQAIMRYILPYTAFLRLSDVHDALPEYTEHLIETDLSIEQRIIYDDMYETLHDELENALRFGDLGLISVMINALLAYPDTAHEPVCVINPRKRHKVLFEAPPAIVDHSPKEAMLLDYLLEEKKQGRKAIVFVVYTQKRDLTGRLATLMKAAGLKPAVLKSSVTTAKREQWIEDRLDEDIDVLITHPKLVETGLDLLQFPSLYFMQTGYNVYTLMQASKRSWRIGQTLPVHAHFMGYHDTAQSDCLRLMQKKITVTQSTAGVVPECGLDILNQGEDSVEMQLARSIVGNQKVDTSLKDNKVA